MTQIPEEITITHTNTVGHPFRSASLLIFSPVFERIPNSLLVNVLLSSETGFDARSSGWELILLGEPFVLSVLSWASRGGTDEGGRERPVQRGGKPTGGKRDYRADRPAGGKRCGSQKMPDATGCWYSNVYLSKPNKRTRSYVKA